MRFGNEEELLMGLDTLCIIEHAVEAILNPMDRVPMMGSQVKSFCYRGFVRYYPLELRVMDNASTS